MNSRRLGTKIIHFIVCMLLISWTAHAGNIDPGSADDQYAWGENIGWVNFSSNGGAPFQIVTSWRLDTDGDGTPDCSDNCPSDPDKTDPGVCGCGVADTDTDGDGTPDCSGTINSGGGGGGGGGGCFIDSLRQRQ